MPQSVREIYEARVSAGEIECDAAQQSAARRLDQLALALSTGARGGGLLSSLKPVRRVTARGLYLYGSVGRGKSMLMDIFFASVPLKSKQRVHFHEFMAAVHDQIAEARQTAGGDPVASVAAELGAKTQLLCLDELQVTNIADAMILGRLFSGLFEARTTVVMTSNCAPGELYKDGLNRALFVPFIRMLEERLEVFELAAAKDFRLDKLAGRRLYFSPCDQASRADIDQHWERLTGHHGTEPVELLIKGRRLQVERASMGVARFDFAELCTQSLGALDYLHVAHAFHTVLLEGIPRFGRETRNEALRFIALIDTLYDNRCCLIASAAAAPFELCPAEAGIPAFERTASRLSEMQSEAYLAGRKVTS